MIAAGQLASSAQIERFKVEAEAAARLDHSNIVPIYEVGEHQGQHFYSMKLIDGGTIADCGLRIGDCGGAAFPESKQQSTAHPQVFCRRQSRPRGRERQEANALS